MNAEQSVPKGSLHPISLVTEEIVNIFSEMGFTVALGPELEDEWHNFDALNVSKYHPARDMQDTFWIKDSADTLDTNGHSMRKVMRTHTSPVQIRYMESHTPPFAIIAPGKVFRNEATDAGHEMQFYQIEGLVVGEDITVANLKDTLLTFFKKIFYEDIELRLTPSYFPFTEPSMEVAVKFNGKWLEIMGAGMVHPNVLRNGGIDPEKYSGFAFGGGIDRIANIKLGVPDIRLYYQGDARINEW